MATKDFLAVDLGAESGRTVLGRFDGGRLMLEETHRFPNVAVRVGHTLHWTVLRLWHEILAGMGKTVQLHGAPTSVGVDTWGVDFGLLDGDGNLLGNPVQYRDPRTDGMIEAAFARISPEKLYAITGLQVMKLNTLYQLLAIRQRNHEPFAGAKTLLLMPDLFTYFLTGQKGAEYTIASTTQMLDATRRQWATALLETLELPTALLPAVVPTGSSVGPMLPWVAEETGCAGTRVFATAGHDTAAAVAAIPYAGATGAGDWAYISSGTWSLMGAELPHPVLTEEARAANFTNEGGVGGTIRLLKNIMGLWLVQQCRRSFEKHGHSYDYAQLTRLAAAASPFTSLVNPDDLGFYAPADMPTALREYCTRTHQPLPADEGALIRCCLESLALRYRWTLERIEALTGRSLAVIHIVGGGSRNELLCQFAADCCGRPVLAGPVEATALGNCLVQAMATGDIGSLQEARAIVLASSLTRTYEPSGRNANLWNDAYSRFLPLLG